MATTASDIANLVNCAISSRKGTGDKHCSYKEGVPAKPFLSTRNYDWNTITDLTAALIAVEVQKGNIIPLPRGYNFERQSEDNVKETSQLGRSALSRKGLYKYMFSWDKDDRLQEVMTSYDSNDVYDYVSADSQGNMKLVSNGALINGATCGLIDTEAFTEPDGQNSGKVRTMIELNNPEDYNTNAVYFAAANLPFSILKVEGINTVTLTPTSFADTATTIVFSALLKDGSTALSGAAGTDFLLTINGTAIPITGGVTIAETGATGVYTISGLTALASNDIIKLSTYDSTTSTVAIIQNSVDVYSGAEVTVVVA
jgi:hypothetical protein